jgi:hypothetical protein
MEAGGRIGSRIVVLSRCIVVRRLLFTLAKWAANINREILFVRLRDIERSSRATRAIFIN